MNESREAWEKLRDSGVLDSIDNEVYEFLLQRGYEIDSRMAWNELRTIGHKLGSQSYNAIQQSFTRLKKRGLLEKVGTHKSPITGFSTGLYKPSCLLNGKVEQQSLF